MSKKKKRLTRKQEKALVGGVLAGLADYYDQDPALVRIIAIVFLVLTGVFPGLLFYLGAWIVMPKHVDEPEYDYTVTK